MLCVPCYVLLCHAHILEGLYDLISVESNTPIANMAAYARKRGFSVTTVAKGRFTYSFSYTSASCLHFCSSYFFEDISRKVLFVRRYGLSIISQYF